MPLRTNTMIQKDLIVYVKFKINMKYLVGIILVCLFGVGLVLSVLGLITYFPSKDLILREGEFEKISGEVVNVNKRQINKGRTAYVQIDIDIMGKTRTIDPTDLIEPSEIKVSDSIAVWYHEEISLCYPIIEGQQRKFPSSTYFFVEYWYYFQIITTIYFIVFLIKYFKK